MKVVSMNVENNTNLSDDEVKQLRQLKQTLDEAGVKYELLTHTEIVKSTQDGVERGMGSLDKMAPTLILKSDKGFLAAIISGETRLSFKKIKKNLGIKDISLAKPDDVLRETGTYVGSVSLINHGFSTIVDSRLTEVDVIYGGCGIPYYTLRINPLDLINVTQAKVFDFTQQKGTI